MRDGFDENEKFVFAKIDVGILAHKTTAKLLSRKGGEGAFAVYIAAICWCRDQMSDGVLPVDVARTLLCGAGARHVDRLVEVGWFLVRADGDYDVWNYAKKNDTRASVEERRARDRKRKQTARMSDRNPNGLHSDSERVPSAFPACASHSAPAPDLEGVQGGPPSEVVPPSESVSRVRALPDLSGSNEPRVPMPQDLPLTPAARVAAELAGVRDVDDEWVKFRGHHVREGKVSTIAGWYGGAWPKWFTDAKRYQARDRVAARAGPSGSALVQPVPATGRIWKSGDGT